MKFLSIASAFAFLGVVHAVDPVVDLSYSKYEGTAKPGGVSEWLGIRYAAPPLGKFRFMAPQPPVYNTTIQKANKHGYLCLANQLGPGNQYGSPRQPMDEDCLFLDVFAPTNATTASRLPVMVFIQGGGWNSNANGNFNGSLLVTNSGMNMIVVTLNYRVGLLGALAGKEVVEGGSLNNGLKDVIAVLQWVQDRVDQFGGDIHHVTLKGDSAGAIIIGHLLASYNGTGLPGYFHAVVAESTSVFGDAQVVDLQSHYDDLVIATGCNTYNNTLDCLRSLNETELQTKSPVFAWTPCIDNDILVAPTYQLYEQRRFRQVPTIYGSNTDEGTKGVDKRVNSSTFDPFFRSALGNITDAQLDQLKAMYPASLNNVTFNGIKLNASYPNAGNEWQRAAALGGELAIRCVAYFQSDMHYAAGNLNNWHYHYDVLDARDLANGNRVYHGVEQNAVWGPNNTDGNPPPGYYTTNAAAVSVVQSYWISFVRTFDPNKLRDPALAEWTPWTIKGRDRLLITNNETRIDTMMEKMTKEEEERCRLVIQYSKAINAYALPLTTLNPFANGTFPDPYA